MCLKTKNDIVLVLQDIQQKLYEADPEWTIFGSAALVMNGIKEIEAQDIDILMTREGAIKAEKLMEGYLQDSDDTPGERFRSHHSHYIIKGIMVDISGQLEIRKDGDWQPVEVKEKVDCQEIHYASLPDCIRLLQLFDRPKDREKLRLLSALHF